MDLNWIRNGRLPLLHQEIGYHAEAAKRDNPSYHLGMALTLEAEILARMGAQEPRWATDPKPLKFGIPDAEREYHRPRRSAAPLRSWVNHATHVIPVEGCHLCQDARRISAAIREAF